MIPKVTFLFICVTFSNYALSASFDCKKARTEIEKKICSTAKLSDLDSKLGVIYKKIRSNSPEMLNKSIVSKQRKWLKERNADCNSLIEVCLEDSYKNQINYLSNMNSLIDANKKIASAFKLGTMEFGRKSNIGFNGIEAKSTLENFIKGDLYSALSIKDKEEVIKNWSDNYNVTTINADVNEDYLVDTIVYQTVGTGSCSKPFVLIRQTDLSLKLAKTPKWWQSEDGAFCNTSLTVFGIENERWLGYIQNFRNGGGRLNMFADMDDSFSMKCSTLFGVKTKYEANRFIPYHDEFRWVFRNKADIEAAINSKEQPGFSVESLRKISQQGTSNNFLLDINGDDNDEEFKLIDNSINIKNQRGKFVPINDFWKLRQLAKKYKYTSYNALSRYSAQYLFFKGDGDELYMIYWSNGELGWRQSQFQVMFLYRLGGDKPEYIDSLMLDPNNTYFTQGMYCN